MPRTEGDPRIGTDGAESPGALLARLAAAGLADPAAVGKLLARAAGGPANERDEMAIAAVASLQLLHHHFIANLAPQRQAQHHARLEPAAL